MDYQQFIAEIQKYWDLRDKGLKKQANNFLFSFTRGFKEDVSEKEADDILFQFCQEYIDEMKFLGSNMLRHHLPFQMTELLNSYFNRECEKGKMPQMRWAYQIFGNYYNPHDPECELDPYGILERAYAHEQCDQQTVDFYFGEQVRQLWWGQHHFPEGCLITKDEFEYIVRTASRILSEKSVNPSLVAEYEYYVKLYHIYYEWEEKGRNDDFYELCNCRGIKYKEILTIYYK